MRARAIASLPLLLACGGCAGWQSALDPQGPAARALGGLLQGFTLVLAGIWLVVLLVLAAALWRRPAVAQGQARRRSAIAVGAACAGTVLVVSGLTLASYMTTLAISAPGEEPLVIRVRGLQWWWEVTYPDASGQDLVTANEIHIPVGRPVRIELSSADVIHSFWVPNLAGKQDMIPGRDNVLTIQAGAAGVHRGQCAEFCGLQHARMAFMRPARYRPGRFAAGCGAARGVGHAARMVGRIVDRRPQDHRPPLHRHCLRVPGASAGAGAGDAAATCQPEARLSGRTSTTSSSQCTART
jgi:cytochrome c oxidase subunit 2